MSEEMIKAYDPSLVEQKWYKFWEEAGLFKPDETKDKAFTIVIPPPNITGSLHMGHALNNSIQDLLIRYKRMCGFRTLWVPGTDHAGIATQNVVERELKKEGKRKEDLGREKFLEKVWEWKKEYGGQITRQLRRLGASCDWSRECFTLDEQRSKAVKRHFVQLYKEGLIYRGKRIINWCPRCQTAISDIEVEHETIKGHLWHIKYGPLTVATTRPETMLGDTAVAVNPQDERYKHMWGQTVELPLVGRHIPVIKDEFVELSFGTGAVKVTPAHDPNDYEMGMRHNLPFVNILTPDGHLTFQEFSRDERDRMEKDGLEGLERFKAREKIVELLQQKGDLVKIEDYETSIGHCYRCKTIIEPYLSDQWFVKVKPLAEAAIAAVEEEKVKFVPERWTKLYLQWMTNLRDWCISRQLWWGHQIPAWYKGEEIYVGEEPPTGAGWKQDPDVFDTWFSSALWPFSTLGWPDSAEASSGKPVKGSDLDIYYPTDVLVTSYDIIFFWVARMVMAGLHFMKKEPFHTVYFNPLVKDIHGKKMSKSWGNVIDPLEVIEKAGADALRFAFLSLLAGQGQDIKLSEDKITEARNFVNKIWNASRFVLMNTPSVPSGHLPRASGEKERGFELADRWILSRLNQTIKQVTEHLENYEFGEAARLLYSFVWSEFCDWYVEIAKIRLHGQDEKAKAEVVAVLINVLENTLKLLHPFMPFITEEIWNRVTRNANKSIMIEKWPEADEKGIDLQAEQEMSLTMEAVRTIRNLRAEMNIPHSKEIELFIISDKPLNESYLKHLTKAAGIKTGRGEGKGVRVKVEGIEIFVPLEGLIDFEKEKARLLKEKEKLFSQIQKLQNFPSGAPPQAIESTRAKEQEFKVRIHLLEERLASL